MKNVSYPKFRWFALLTLLCMTVSQGIVLIAPAPLVGEVANSLQLSLGQVTGAVMGAFIICVALGGIIGGMVLDKIGIPKTYIISVALMVLGSLLVLVIGDTLGGLVVSRVIQGLGAGPIMSSVSRLASEWFPKKERAIVTGIQGMSVSLGIAIGFGLSPVINIATGHWQQTVAFSAVPPCVALILTIILALGPKSPVMLHDAQDSTELIESQKDFKRSLKLPVFWLAIVICFCIAWVMQGYNDITPGHIAVEPPVGLGLGAAVAGRYMGLMQVAFMVGSVASGFLLTKVFKGNYRLLLFSSFIMVAIFCTSVLLPAIKQNSTSLLIVLLIAGFFQGIPLATVMGFISNFYPEHITGRIGGITMGLSIFGGVLGVAAGSYALHHTGFYTVSVLVVGVISVVGALGSFALKTSSAQADQSRLNKSAPQNAMT